MQSAFAGTALLVDKAQPAASANELECLGEVACSVVHQLSIKLANNLARCMHIRVTSTYSQSCSQAQFKWCRRCH